MERDANLVVAAAGRGERLGASQPKAFVPLGGSPIVLHTLRRLAALDVFVRAIVVVPETHIAVFRELAAAEPWPFHVETVAGGSERQESVRRGLAALADDCEFVVVHDAVRPFVSPQLVVACLEAARSRGAAVAALPVRDTVKRAAGTVVTATVDRRGMWMVQTPQAFRLALLREAHRRAAETGHAATDDAAVVEWAGGLVEVVPGEPENVKITGPADLCYAERLLASASCS
jgi:2-C-methyl-D-erythritol 4-phosphate cytidylyltransferase